MAAPVIHAIGGMRSGGRDGPEAARRRCSRSAARRSRRVADLEVGRFEDRGGSFRGLRFGDLS
jgi:hypothetical protein